MENEKLYYNELINIIHGLKYELNKPNTYIHEILKNECDYNIINNLINTLEQTNNYIAAC
jgi:hypothetical protein